MLDLSKRTKDRLKDAAGGVLVRCETFGLVERLPAFVHDYHDDYPGLRELEAAHTHVRDECLRLLERPEQLLDIERLGGEYTQGGIHVAKWKVFVLKLGAFLPDNCARAPKTAELLAGVPGLYTAFFSILYPGERITPHWGYWKGFVRYHLGVVIPNDNRNRECWLRINTDREDNARDDRTLVERGQKYHWQNGRGVIFDDTNLHDAGNDSDQIRVVLWLDLARKLPWPLSVYNRACLAVGFSDDSVKSMSETGKVTGD